MICLVTYMHFISLNIIFCVEQVLLPDRTTVVVSVRKNSQSTEVYDAVMAKAGVSIDLAKYFALFEIVEFGFERKLLSSEFPYNLYIQNYRYVK